MRSLILLFHLLALSATLPSQTISNKNPPTQQDLQLQTIPMAFVRPSAQSTPSTPSPVTTAPNVPIAPSSPTITANVTSTVTSAQPSSSGANENDSLLQLVNVVNQLIAQLIKPSGQGTTTPSPTQEPTIPLIPFPVGTTAPPASNGNVVQPYVGEAHNVFSLPEFQNKIRQLLPDTNEEIMLAYRKDGSTCLIYNIQNGSHLFSVSC